MQQMMIDWLIGYGKETISQFVSALGYEGIAWILCFVFLLFILFNLSNAIAKRLAMPAVFLAAGAGIVVLMMKPTPAPPPPAPKYRPVVKRPPPAPRPRPVIKDEPEPVKEDKSALDQLAKLFAESPEEKARKEREKQAAEAKRRAELHRQQKLAHKAMIRAQNDEAARAIDAAIARGIAEAEFYNMLQQQELMNFFNQATQPRVLIPVPIPVR